MSRPPEGRTLHWTVRAGIGAGLLGGSWWALQRPALQRADVRVGDALRSAGSGAFERAVAVTTDLGSVYAVCGIGAALAASGRRRLAADVLGVGAVAWNLTQLNKIRVGRQRPYEADDVRRLIGPPTGSSFPSGHAAVGAAVFSMLTESARGPRSRALLHLLGLYVALSRVYVGVHYPTDALGGAGLGLALGSLWRGPIAGTSRALFDLGLAVAARLAPPLLRAAVWVALGLRLRHRHGDRARRWRAGGR